MTNESNIQWWQQRILIENNANRFLLLLGNVYPRFLLVPETCLYFWLCRLQIAVSTISSSCIFTKKLGLYRAMSTWKFPCLSKLIDFDFRLLLFTVPHKPLKFGMKLTENRGAQWFFPSCLWFRIWSVRVPSLLGIQISWLLPITNFICQFLLICFISVWLTRQPEDFNCKWES